jgi:hypothetical protein
MQFFIVNFSNVWIDVSKSHVRVNMSKNPRKKAFTDIIS